VRLVTQILTATALDSVFGDPRGLPHPVKLMGRLARGLEGPLRRRMANDKAAGVVAAATVIGTTAVLSLAVTKGARRLHTVLGDLMSVALIWTAIAPKDLAVHALRVHAALEAGDLPGARKAVGMMVGRDVDALDEAGVVRAAVESVAENTVDGVISPLLYASFGGAPAAMAYKAASTLDSTFGYKNERYLHFGWASARCDDVANYLPARLNVAAMAAAAALLGLDARGLLDTVRSDGRKHASPNSGLAEAAMAGALGVRLGGPVVRGGVQMMAPELGTPVTPLQRGHIRDAVRLMWVTTAVVVGALGLALHFLAPRRTVTHSSIRHAPSPAAR
jgi:adenosylcobinamide-phosphate synthase